MKGYAAFPKATALLERHHQIVQCPIKDTRYGESYPSAEVQLDYSIALADWAIQLLKFNTDSSIEYYSYAYT